MLIVALAFTLFVTNQTNLTGQIIFVDQSANGENTGLNWDDAFVDLQDALAEASSGNEIWVAAGQYYPSADRNDRNARFILPDGVSLYGGFGGFESNLTQRNWNLFSSTLSGDINQNGSLFGNSHTVLDLSETRTGSRVDGFTITGGNAEVLASEGYPRNNSGGGIYNSGGRAVIANCVIAGNSANQGAGMANLYGADVRIENTVFRNNLVVIPGGGGGMLNAVDSKVELISSLFDSNESLTAGGAVLNIYRSELIIEHSRFLNNLALNGAAIFLYDSCRVHISSSFIQGNRAEGLGGAISSLLYNEINIQNSLITGNMAENGGAFYAERGDFFLINCTVTGNRAEIRGGGIFNDVRGNFRLYNSIFWENKADEEEGAPYSSVFHRGNWESVVFKHTIIQDSGISEEWNSDFGKDGGGNREYDPLFIQGLTSVEAPSTEGNFRLTECSPAVNFGKNALLQGLITVDIVGNARIIDGIVDKGAYEFADEVPPPDIECVDAVIELELDPPNIKAVNDFFVVLDSCGPVMGSVLELDSLQFDCSDVGINSFTVAARDLYSEMTDSCEVQIEVVPPTYIFTLNGRPMEPGEEFTFCPNTPLELRIDSTVFPSSPLVTDFRFGDRINSDILLSRDQEFPFYLEEDGVYPITFLSISDANGCTLDEVEASQYYYFIRIADERDTTKLFTEICRGGLFEGIPINRDTTIVTGFVNQKGCDSLVISAIQLYDSPELIVEGDPVFCYGEHALISASRGFENYTWSHNGSDQREIKVHESGIYTLSATDSYGCTHEMSFSVSQLDPIVPKIDTGPATCPKAEDGYINVMTVSGGIGDYHLMVDEESFNHIPVLIEGRPGTYFLEIQDEAGCIYSDLVEVGYEIEPSTAIIGPSRIEYGDSLIIHAEFNLPNPKSAEWKVNGQSISEVFSLGLLPEEDVFVEFKMTDVSNCEAFDSRTIEVFRPASVFIPNAFSPNRDGINDAFTAFTDGDHSIELLRIYDRWGNLVFEARDIPANSPKFGWDGHFRGSMSENGQYLYHIELRDAEELRQFSGSVVLIR